MINTTHHEPLPDVKLINFLNKEYHLSNEAINLGIKHSKLEAAPLPIVLRSFGLISLDQFHELLDWIEHD